jgi:hypothetical protein
MAHLVEQVGVVRTSHVDVGVVLLRVKPVSFLAEICRTWLKDSDSVLYLLIAVGRSLLDTDLPAVSHGSLVRPLVPPMMGGSKRTCWANKTRGVDECSGRGRLGQLNLSSAKCAKRIGWVVKQLRSRIS